MSTLVLVRGLPGSGKSTFANHAIYQKHLGSLGVHLEADDYMLDDSGVYNFRPELLGAAHKWCIETTRIMLRKGLYVFVSNTFTTLKEMNPYISMAEETKSKLFVYKSVGNFGSIHGVPEETIARMKERWEDYPGEIIINENLNYR